MKLTAPGIKLSSRAVARKFDQRGRRVYNGKCVLPNYAWRTLLASERAKHAIISELRFTAVSSFFINIALSVSTVTVIKPTGTNLIMNG